MDHAMLTYLVTLFSIGRRSFAQFFHGARKLPFSSFGRQRRPWPWWPDTLHWTLIAGLPTSRIPCLVSRRPREWHCSFQQRPLITNVGNVLWVRLPVFVIWSRLWENRVRRIHEAEVIDAKRRDVISFQQISDCQNVPEMKIILASIAIGIRLLFCKLIPIAKNIKTLGLAQLLFIIGVSIAVCVCWALQCVVHRKGPAACAAV